MRLSIITLFALLTNIFVITAQEKQVSENPFDKLGYDPLVATSSRGEFAEFHDQADIVEIGSVLFNTKTNEVVKILDDGETTLDLSSATVAMSIDPLCEKYYWISPYAYCLNNPVKFVDKDGKQVGIPMNMFGSPEQLRSYAAQRKAEKIAIDAVTPVGVSVSLTGNVSGGIEGGFSVSAAYLTDGIDAGTINGYAKGSGGGGVPGGSLTLGIELIYFNGNKLILVHNHLRAGQ